MASPDGIRRRGKETVTRSTESVKDEGESRGKAETDDSDPGVGVVDILRIIFGLLLLNCLLSYFVTNDNYTWGYKPWYIRPRALKQWMQGPVLLTDAQLVAYDGSDPAKPVYVALNGTIYDVTAGARVYGPGGPYHGFAGKDAARAFVTGCFADDLTADLRGVEWTYIPKNIPTMEEERTKKLQLTKREVMDRFREVSKAKAQVKGVLEGWAMTFRGENGKDYFEVGKVVREPGWLNELPRRKLCDAAVQGRPEAGEEAKDAGAEHRS